jgi:hypothetical protein
LRRVATKSRFGGNKRQKTKDKRQKLRRVATNRSEAEFGEAKSRFGGNKRQKTKVEEPRFGGNKSL